MRIQWSQGKAGELGAGVQRWVWGKGMVCMVGREGWGTGARAREGGAHGASVGEGYVGEQKARVRGKAGDMESELGKGGWRTCSQVGEGWGGGLGARDMWKGGDMVTGVGDGTETRSQRKGWGTWSQSWGGKGWGTWIQGLGREGLRTLSQIHRKRGTEPGAGWWEGELSQLDLCMVRGFAWIQGLFSGLSLVSQGLDVGFRWGDGGSKADSGSIMGSSQVTTSWLEQPKHRTGDMVIPGSACERGWLIKSDEIWGSKIFWMLWWILGWGSGPDPLLTKLQPQRERDTVEPELESVCNIFWGDGAYFPPLDPSPGLWIEHEAHCARVPRPERLRRRLTLRRTRPICLRRAQLAVCLENEAKQPQKLIKPINLSFLDEKMNGFCHCCLRTGSTE